MLTRTLAALTLATSLFACVSQDEKSTTDALQDALPTADQMRIKLPDSAVQGLAAAAPATYYEATRDVTKMLNGGTAWVLILIHSIVQYPVTTVSGDTYTWGPWSEALDPAEYKLDVRALADGTFEYKLSGRSKTQAGSQFEVIISGSADPRPGDDKSKGSFTLDFDAGRRVNPIDANPNDKGKMTATYDFGAHTLGVKIVNTQSADYSYQETADGGGNMTFAISANQVGGSAQDKITLRSRWLATGAGRADAKFEGADVPATGATLSECWDAMFSRVYYTDNVGLEPMFGLQSACAFAAADLPK